MYVNDIWAMGWGTEPALFHFDGVSWTLDTLKIPFNPDAYPDILIFNMTSFNNDLYFIATKWENNSALRTVYFYKRVSSKWTCIDSSAIDIYKYQEPRFGNRLIVTGDNKLMSYGDWGMYEWDGKNWIHKNSIGCWKIVNSFENNLLAAGIDSKIYLFNGSVWQPIDILMNSTVAYRDIWTNGREAFITGYMVKGWPMRSIIWHGK